jgi:hypothetical protein
MSKFLRPMTNGPGYLRVGLQGKGGSGKTRTAAELAIGVREYFKLPGPIAFFDTEPGAGYIAPLVRKRTGLDLLVHDGRALDDLIEMAKDCAEHGVSVFIVDSVTHVWREACQAFIDKINSGYARKGWSKRIDKLEFQHYAPIKRKWGEWTDAFLNLSLHIIVCGRAGDEYAYEENDDGKKELRVVGTKMKAEAEFGFEPSLGVEMLREQVPAKSGRGFEIVRRAVVIKDRFGVMDGHNCENPTFDFFRPHVELLRPELHRPIDTSPKTQYDVDAGGDDEWARERRARDIACEEIQGLLISAYPSGAGADKKAKLDALEQHFNTRSWTKLERQTSSGELRAGLERLRVALGVAAPRVQSVEDPMPSWADAGEPKSEDAE